MSISGSEHDSGLPRGAGKESRFQVANFPSNAIRKEAQGLYQRTASIRWTLVALLAAANFLSFLDRLLLAAAGPALKDEFHISNAMFGVIIAAFAASYAIASPLWGLLVDRIGFAVAAILCVAIWSAAGIGTGLSAGVAGLLFSRALLGVAESAALPVSAQATARNLPNSEWAMASSVGALGLTAGSILAPLFSAYFASSWRTPFLVAGGLGGAWIVLWLLLVPRVGGFASTIRESIPSAMPVREKAVWQALVAYALVSTVLIVWQNWTTVLLVRQFHLGPREANADFAWIPPVSAAAGGFGNALVCYFLIRRGRDPIRTRIGLCKWAAPLAASFLIVPLASSPVLLTALVCLGMFAAQVMIGSIAVLPMDLLGHARSASGISLLACASALLQAVVSPLIGGSFDSFGLAPVCIACTVLPLLGAYVATRIRKKTPILAAGFDA